jgi:hypothetical protein
MDACAVREWMLTDTGMWTVLRRYFGKNAVTYASSLDLWIATTVNGQLLAFRRGGDFELVESSG